MIMFLHLAATLFLIAIVLTVLHLLGYSLPLRIILLISIGMLFFGVGIDIDHHNGKSMKTLVQCGLVTSEEQYDEDCSMLHRNEMHTSLIIIILVIYFLTWMLHLYMDGRWHKLLDSL